jgi:hypothetical protein
MGNPHYSDDYYQCFNPAKNFQLDWYDDAKITVDPRVPGYTETLTLVGIAEYDLAGNNPVAVRMSTGEQSPGGGDIFVGFNRATGPNQYNVEGDDQVTIVQVSSGTGTYYSMSYLRAKLSQGQSHYLYNFGGTGKTVTVTVNSINIETFPGTAVVTITDSPPPTPRPSRSPSMSYGSYSLTTKAGKKAKAAKRSKGNGYVETPPMSYGSYSSVGSKGGKRI